MNYKNSQNFPEPEELVREETREEGRSLTQDLRAIVRMFALTPRAMGHH